MKPWAEMSAANRGGVIGGVAAVVAALLYGAWTVSRPAPVAEAVQEPAPAQAAPEAAVTAAAPEAPAEAVAAETEVAEAAPEVAEADAADPAPAEAEGVEEAPAEEAAEEAAAAPEAEVVAEEPAPDVVAEPVITPPSFDLVRVEQDGSALVAGSAVAGSILSLRVTGAEIAAVPADQTGKFVAMFNLAPSPAPRVLSLVMRLEDGMEVPAEGSVVIAPTVAPVALAAAATAEPVAAAEPVAEAVAAPVAPAALLVTDAGAKVLQAANDLPGGLVVNVTIDTITYTPEGAVQLAGRGSAERVVRLYLDNAQLTETSVSGAGDWAVTLPEVEPGVYTLRADQLDAAGKVTSRFETPFKRETVEALAAASGAGVVGAEADAAASAETAAPAVAPSSVTVQPGFTLWRIARDTLGEGILYVQVFEANKDQIRDPDLIYPGQVFAIPDAE